MEHKTPVVAHSGVYGAQALADWNRAFAVSSGTAPASNIGRIVSAAGLERESRLLIMHSDYQHLWCSIDNGLTWTQGGYTLETAPMVDFSADIDPTGVLPCYVLQLCSGIGFMYLSTDAGITWGSAITLPTFNNWNRIRRSFEFDTTFIVGNNQLAKTTNVGNVPTAVVAMAVPGAWTAQVSGNIFTAPKGSSGRGVAVVSQGGGDTRRYLYTLNGTSWTEAGVHGSTFGGVRWFTWSEYYRKWFCITQRGVLFAATALNATWDKLAEFYMPSGTSRYWWIEAVGSALVIGGDGMGEGPTPRYAGNIMITTDDFSPGRTFVLHEGTGVYPDVCHHEGRLLASQVTGVGSPYGRSIITGPRVPYLGREVP